MAISNNLNLLTEISNLLNNEHLSDVIFEVKDGITCERFFAHKLILALNSSVFKTLLYEMQTDSSKKIFTFSNVTPSAVLVMLCYLYKQEFTVETLDEAYHVQTLAQKYMLKGLEQECNEFIAKNELTLDNVFGLYTVALQENENISNGLLILCRQFLCCHASDALKSSTFVTAPIEVVKDIFNLDGLCVESEIEVIEAALWWSSAFLKQQKLPDNPSCFRECLKPLLPYLRILTLTLDEFISLSDDHELFNKNEKSLFIRHILQPKEKLNPLPLPYCCLRKKRMNKAPAEIEEPIKSSVQIQQPIKSPIKIELPIKSPLETELPIKSPTSEQQFSSLKLYCGTKLEIVNNPIKLNSTKLEMPDNFPSPNSFTNSKPIFQSIPNVDKTESVELLTNNKMLSHKPSEIKKSKPVTMMQTNAQSLFSLKPSVRVAPQFFSPLDSLTTDCARQTFGFRLEKCLDTQKDLSSMVNKDMKSTLHIKMLRGSISIQGFLLKLMDKIGSTEVLEVSYSFTDPRGNIQSDEFKKELCNGVIPVTFPKSLVLSPNDEADIEVEVENLLPARCGMLWLKKQEFNSGSSVKAEFTLSSNQGAINGSFFFLLEQLFYSINTKNVYSF